MRKRVIALFMACLVVFACGCAPIQKTLSYSANAGIVDAGNTETTTEGNDKASKKSLFSQNGYGTKWVDSGVIGAVKSTDSIRLQDDFAATVNQEWLVSSDQIALVFSDAEDSVYDKKIEILEEISGMEGKKAEEFNKYYKLATDWETRNAQGMDVLKSYLKEIDDISSKEELYAWIIDREKNPGGIAPIYYEKNARSEDEPTKMVCCMEIPQRFLGSDDLYYNGSEVAAIETKDLKEGELFIVLDALGYTEKEKKKLIRANYRMEKKLLSSKSAATYNGVDPYTMTRKDAVALAGSYPLDEYLSSFGIKDEAPVSVDKSLLKKLDRICGNGNLENMKAFLKVQFIKDNYYNLDRNILDRLLALSQNLSDTSEKDIYTPEKMEKIIFFNRYLGQSAMSAAFNELYLEKYVSEEDQKRLEEMVQSIIDSYREILQNEDWLSEEGRKLAVEKLDNVATHVVSPNNELIDFNELNLVSEEDGGSFLEAQLQLSYFAKCQLADTLYKTYDKTVWHPFLGPDTLMTNAVYMSGENAIYILAGVCEKPFYYEGISDEELLGSLGVIVGHELTHGFDQNGIHFDKDGIMRDWFPAGDKMTFNDRVMKLSSFYSGLRPLDQTPYNGSRVSAEATADMGGMRITLNIAKNKPDFDYDKYFKAEAVMWRSRNSLDVEKYLFEKDNHPLNYLRANVTDMQFDEFYETYNIQPGDGMYLESDKRIAVW